jgi:hypothetical protein
MNSLSSVWLLVKTLAGIMNLMVPVLFLVIMIHPQQYFLASVSLLASDKEPRTLFESEPSLIWSWSKGEHYQ